MTATDTATEAKPRLKAGFELVKVGAELPPDAPKAPSITQLYKNLEAIQAEPGEWFEVAQYATSNGAKNTLKAIGAGERKIPEGQFDLEVRTRPRVDGNGRSSVLMAKYLNG